VPAHATIDNNDIQKKSSYTANNIIPVMINNNTTVAINFFIIFGLEL
jgi:hypothetical protein